MAPQWVEDTVEWSYQAEPDAGGASPCEERDDHEGLSRLLVRALAAVPLAGVVAIDIGTGRGRLAFLLAARAARVVGVDRDAAALADARREAAARGLGHVAFVEADAEAPGADYRALAGAPPGLVGAHLCLSDAILVHAARALAPGGHVAVAGFHADQWAETGVRSRFAYDEPGLERALDAAGLEPLFLGVERAVVSFGSPADATRGFLERSGLGRKLAARGRLAGFEAYLAGGGRRLTTRARVVAVAVARAR